MKKYIVSALMLLGITATGARAAVDFPCIDNQGFPIPCFFGYATSVDIARLQNHVDTVNSSINNQTDQLKKELASMQSESQGTSKQLHQDMKNYIALAQLDKAKADAQLLFQTPPNNAVTQSYGQFESDLKTQADLLKAYYTHDAFSRDMLSTTADVNPDVVVDNHLKNYCSLTEQKQNLCVSAKKDQNEDALKTDVPVDLEAQSLFKSTYSDANDEVAADAYARNLINPVPVPLLPADQLFLNQKDHVLSDNGKRNLLALYRQQAFMSLAQQSLINTLTDRLQFEQKDAQGNIIKDEKGNPIISSRNELISNEATRRFNDKGWYQQMNTLSTQALLREIANMMALQLTMHERDSERLERIEALMSAQVAYVAQMIGTEEKAQQKMDEFKQQKDSEKQAVSSNAGK